MKDLLSIDFFHPKSKLGYLQRHFYNFLSILQRVSSERRHFELKTNNASNSKSHPKKKTLPSSCHQDWDSAQSVLTQHTYCSDQDGGPAGPRATDSVAHLQIPAEPESNFKQLTNLLCASISALGNEVNTSYLSMDHRVCCLNLWCRLYQVLRYYNCDTAHITMLKCFQSLPLSI